MSIANRPLGTSGGIQDWLSRGLTTGGGGAPVSTPYSIPTFFTTTSIFPWAAVDTGSAVTSTFNAATFEDSGGPFYISPSGSDLTGNGSSLLPWQTISKALTTAATGSLINMAAGRYQLPATTDGAGKLMSFVAATLGTVFVGNLLANTDVSSWGTPASGRQQITLTTGVVAGFVDTTVIDASTGGTNQVSLNSLTAAAIATLQSAGKAGIYRPSLGSGSTASTLGASDARSLTNTFDTTLLAWRNGAPTTFFAGSTGGKLYFENITFVGELTVQPTLGRIIENNCDHVGGDNLVESVVSNVPTYCLRNARAVGCRGSGSDLLDINCTHIVENVVAYNAALGGGDQSYTSHGGYGLVINCTFIEGDRGATVRDGRQGYFGGKASGASCDMNIGASAPGESHLKYVTFQGTPSIATIQTQTLQFNVAFYDYNNCLVGATYFTATGGTPAPINRYTGKPTVQQTLLYLDPSQIGTLFQTTDTSTPVTADGQNVGRINCAAGTGGYVTLGSTLGTAIYHTDGTHSWITLASARWVLNPVAPWAEDTTMITGLNSTDTVFFLMGNPVNSAWFMDFRSTGNPYAGCSPFPVSANGGFAVNAGTPSFLASIKSTACNGANNVFTMRRADIMYPTWRTANLFCGGTPGANSLDMKWYGSRFVAYGTDAEIKTAEQAMGLKMGTVIP